MGAVLGEGWWTGMTTFEATNNNYYGDQSALMAMLVVTYADGTDETIVTDAENWECFTDGPIRLASFFQGERYDATKEAAVEGWTEADLPVMGQCLVWRRESSSQIPVWSPAMTSLCMSSAR